MSVKCVEIDTENISHSVTLTPRLDYSVSLLEEIVDVISQKRDDLKQSNKDLVSDFDESDKTHLQAIELERIMAFSLEILTLTKRKTRSITNVQSIPQILPSSIPLIRTISAQLYELVPDCSQKLSELSVHLGSIVLDSAALTHASFDFSQSNIESSTLLDEVKLMVDSKISKQYPNVDFFKLCNT
ncbi:hypothetical protein SCCGRSA3_01787 [Marine Group I thaumarchaeote SCGC RSA3]|uniref:Uncharacterized protein n=3 Tax=Marine Group I TaxID=905826 RepID=A0A081RPD1_9ARCH|nr:hypothetical protein AAA799N04_00452 [Marine Group I thaumarchaeote SCGC AAA799-N04]KFM16110.1 hypothetical protein AAA799D11_00909 [Marine Group I thaumarchaeote SCGC AAA799-D11]KFM17847.1 hypothetical protein SCCGRSA3_01787 [Marine Group I thaumarchaeote SCGC RSA3]